MKYHFRVEADGKWFTASCIELEGCRAQERSVDKVLVVAKEVLDAFLNEPQGSGVVFPAPQEKLEGKDIVAIEVDPEIAFGMLMRQYRITRKMTQAQMAALLDMVHLTSYQRLERRSNPTLGLIKKVHDRLPGFPLEAILS
jgi:DNA-binding XRE family transcriptional regulator/predicted RNase H-like HicB family nuclease